MVRLQQNALYTCVQKGFFTRVRHFFLKKIPLKSVKLIFLYIESKKLYRNPGPSPQEATVARKTLEQDQAHMRGPSRSRLAGERERRKREDR